MFWRNTTRQFGAIAKGFHWIVAILVLVMIGVGLYMTRLEIGPTMFQLYALHKSVGVTVLCLVLLRLVWRVSSKPPPALPNHLAWEKHLALVSHGFLYLALFMMPLSGWIMSSAKGFSVSVFGLFTLPDLVRPDESLAALTTTFHQITAYTLIFMIGLHVAGALKHHLIDRDDTLRRMLPFGKPKSSGEI